MEQNAFIAAVRRNIGMVFLTAVFVAAASFLFLVVFEKSFMVRTDFLITQNNPNSQDFYAMSRSSEYIGKVLSEAVYSDRFIDAVIETGKVSSNFLPLDRNDRLEEWAKRVNIRKNLELGIIQVEVFDNDQKQAGRLSQAIADVMTQRNNLFRGGDEKSVEVRILSGPIVEKNPSASRLVLAAIGGFLFGGLLALLRIFVKTELFPKTSRGEFFPH